MKKVSKQAAYRASRKRLKGYLRDIAQSAVEETAELWILSDQDFARIATQYAPSGPGTELKALLAKIGIHASPTCKCNKMAKKMDEWGQDSLNHIEEIVDVMQETAAKRGLPFVRAAGAAMVRIACWKAKKKGNGK